MVISPEPDCFDNRASGFYGAQKNNGATIPLTLARPLPGLSVPDSERGFGGEPAG